jgi:hypothetical protein
MGNLGVPTVRVARRAVLVLMYARLIESASTVWEVSARG